MFTQYKLPYGFDALEPAIDALTMETHYTKHHATYTKKLNEAAEKAGVAGQEIETVLSSLDDISDASLRKAVRNNGGGFYNHNLYFSTISPNGGGKPQGELGKAIQAEWETFEAFAEKLGDLANNQFGSGWAWLSVGPGRKLALSASPNQDNPLMEGKGFIPILAVDVWEHAYYLKYKNVRADYVKAFFNVIDWEAVQQRYLSKQ